MEIIKFIKEWTLPCAMAAGACVYLLFAEVPFLEPVGEAVGPWFLEILPVLIFMTLYVTFCKIRLHDLRLRSWHVLMQAIRIAMAGALVVADRFCYGSFPGRQEIVLTDDEDALTQVCRNYLQTTLCVRHSAQHKVQKRLDFAAQLAEDYHADGIIYEQIKFCTYWSYERALASHIMHNEYNIPTLSIDRPYMSRTSGQLRTRVQAFVESIEIKKIKAKRGQEVK